MEVVTILAAVTMLFGLVGIVIPAVPGLVLIWLAALVYGLFEGFGSVGVVAFVLITFLTIAGEALGYILPGRAAGRSGAPSSSIMVGLLCGVVGFFVIPVFGFPIGAVLGIFLAEAARTSDPSAAWRTTLATLVGFGVGALVQLFIGVVIILTWLAWVIAG